jgi:hypothetical protein
MSFNKERDKKAFFLLGFVEIILISFLISSTLYLVYIVLLFYSHEIGHIMGGLANDVLTGKQIQNYTISNWIPSPFSGLSMPQQTHIEGQGSALFIIGGIYSTMITVGIICYIIYKILYFKIKNWILYLILLIPIFTAIQQFNDNFICGTDNPIHQPFPICNDNFFIFSFLHYNGYLLIALFFIIIFSIFLDYLPYLIDKILVFKGYTADYL